MNYTVDNIKSHKIQFDDYIAGTFMKCQYTHDSPILDIHIEEHYIKNNINEYVKTPIIVPTKYQKMFLIFILIDNKWIVQPEYFIGIKNAINGINEYDLKQFKKLQNNGV